MMMSSKKNAILSLITVFLLGCALGIIVNRFIKPNPPKPARHGDRGDRGDFFFEMFTKELELDTVQQDSLRSLLAELREQFQESGKIYFERGEEIRKQFGASLEQILSEPQRAKYREMVEQFERDRKAFEAKKPRGGDGQPVDGKRRRRGQGDKEQISEDRESDQSE